MAIVQFRDVNELRQRIVPDSPDGWLPLDQAARALGVARQTVLHKVQRGELAAVHVTRGKRKHLSDNAKRQPARHDREQQQHSVQKKYRSRKTFEAIQKQNGENAQY